MTPAQREIIEDVAQRHDLTVALLQSKHRMRSIAHPRQEAMYLLRATGRWSLPQIGRVLGCRDHTTVLFGIRAFERRRAEDAGYPHPQPTT